MTRAKDPKSARRTDRTRGIEPSVPPRIIGGQFRGRRLLYSGDMRTRPMKDRVREAVFNLVGTAVRGKHAVDLFAGTGALGLEAMSRGASHATFLEQHFPTAELIRQNIAALGVAELCEVVPGNTFAWFRRKPDLGCAAWLVFCSPPYEFFVERLAEMLELLAGLMEAAPAQSIFVVESDERFDGRMLPDASAWEVRPYRPAIVSVYRKPAVAAARSV